MSAPTGVSGCKSTWGDVLDAVTKSLTKYAPRDEAREMAYGTAGFRSKASDMPPAVYRCCLVAALRSLSASRKSVGVCITASHNPEPDNGVKLMDPSGGMLARSFEEEATKICNAPDPVTVFTEATERITGGKLERSSRNPFAECSVLVASDTRPSSPELTDIALRGIADVGAIGVPYGLLTTPQLHWMVFKANEMKVYTKPMEQQQWPALSMFENQFTDTFLEFFAEAGIPTANASESLLVVDGSNGVGGLRGGGRFPKVALENVGVLYQMRNSTGQVNFNCGAEHVQKKLTVPQNFFTGGILPAERPADADSPTFDGIQDYSWMPCAAVDGDADRVVCFTQNETGALQLLDGDKISVLFVKALLELCKRMSGAPPTASRDETIKPLRIGVVQTAFANGASTSATTQIGKGFEKLFDQSGTSEGAAATISFEVSCQRTGVKFIHAKAEEYDIGSYFESNGHGSLVVNYEALDKWAFSLGRSKSKEYRVLLAFLKIFNPVAGDAFADILAVIASLRLLKMDFRDFVALYNIYPSKQIQIPMERSVLNLLKPHPVHEKFLLSPLGLQEKIDAVVATEPNSRAFCRPSGTENVARIYVEAPNNVEKLAESVETAVLSWHADQK